MKNKIIILLAFAIILAIGSCAAMMSVVDAGAQAAGATGLISENTAAAISTSARAIGSAAEEISPEQEYYIGRAVAANILSTYRIWNGSPAQTAYLNRICMAIVINSSRPDVFNGYKVAILDSTEINAFATPGGHIFVTRGLINTARSEDALAAVIAHEVAHIQLQHGIKAIKNSRITNAVLITGASAALASADMNVSELTDVLAESVGEIVQTLVTNGYSRDQEFEADRLAVTLLANSGYKPAALIEMLQNLPSSGTSGFGKTHPQPAQRITNAQTSINRLPAAPDNSSLRVPRFATATR